MARGSLSSIHLWKDSDMAKIVQQSMLARYQGKASKFVQLSVFFLLIGAAISVRTIKAMLGLHRYFIRIYTAIKGMLGLHRFLIRIYTNDFLVA